MIFRVTNPGVGRSPKVFEAVKRAIVGSGFERDPDPAARYLLERCVTHWACGLWLAVHGGEVVGVVACSLPQNPLAQWPEIWINANLGASAGEHRALCRAAIEFVKAAGYNKLVAWDRTGRGDRVFERYTRPLGVGRPIGTMWEFVETQEDREKRRGTDGHQQRQSER